MAVIGVGNGVFDLLEKELDRKIGVVGGLHPLVVLLKITGADLGIGDIEVSEDVKYGDIAVSDVGLFQAANVNVVDGGEELLFKGVPNGDEVTVDL